MQVPQFQEINGIQAWKFRNLILSYLTFLSINKGFQDNWTADHKELVELEPH